ncbi:MAG: rod shape-determining protein MreD [Leptospiraceae bacterium]|nr:rod shape-determining protein MreD [Leptospiraceae bacterium]MDW7977092.1 rod shape-determining protein MreD [Leptospiraceae bacterium]
MLEFFIILLGLIFSYFLKDINFLGLEFEFFKIGSIYPDFLLIFIIYFAMKTDEFKAIWIAFFGGLLEDSTILSFSPEESEFVNVLGIHSLIYPLVALVIAKLQKHLDTENFKTIMFVVFVSSLVSRIYVWFVMGILDDFYSSYSFIGPSIYTSVLAPVWFLFLKWIYRL